MRAPVPWPYRAGLVLVSALPLLLAFACYAGEPPSIRIPISDCIQPLEPGGVADWGEMVFEALGASDRTESPPALTAAIEARRSALRNLKSAAGAIRVNGSQSVADLAAADEELREALDSLAQHGEIVAEWPTQSWHTKAIAAARIWGSQGSLGALIAQSLKRLREANGTLANLPAIPPPLRQLPPRRLVIDARGFDVTPALFPRISDGEGQEFFQDIPPDTLQGSPFFVYARQMPQARPGETLFILVAVRAEGVPACDLVVEAEPVRRWQEEAGIKPDVWHFSGVTIVY